MQKKHAKKDFMLGVMIGSTVGALSAMMCTSKKGHAIQKAAAAKYHEFERYLQKTIHKNKNKVAKIAKTIRKSKNKVAKIVSKIRRRKSKSSTR